jgi:hypothetical protein
VFAGLVAALVTQILLLLLGAGIGLVAIGDTEGEAWAALGYGATAWLVVSTIIAGFVGAMVASRLASVPNRLDGTLNGLISWGLAQLVTLYLAATAMGALVGGATNILTAGMQAAGQAAGQAAEERPERPGGYGYVRPEEGRETGARVQEEAQELGEQAQQKAEEVGRRAQEVIAGRDQQAEQAAEKAAMTAGQVALLTLAMLLLSGGAAAIGGYLGTPKTWLTGPDYDVDVETRA